MLLFVVLPERSAARKICPTRPSGLIGALNPTVPPMLTGTDEKVGVTAAIFALLERRDHTWLVFKLTPPIKRLPSASTSGVPHLGVFGRKIGLCQTEPPLIERLNCLPPKLFPSVLQNWYWNPCPLLFVLSIVNHCLSPPFAGLILKNDWPPSSEGHISSKTSCSTLR